MHVPHGEVRLVPAIACFDLGGWKAGLWLGIGSTVNRLGRCGGRVV